MNAARRYQLRPELEVVETGESVFLVAGIDDRRPEIVLSLSAVEFGLVFVAAPVPKTPRKMGTSKPRPAAKKKARRGLTPAAELKAKRTRLTDDQLATLRRQFEKGVGPGPAAAQLGRDPSNVYRLWAKWKAEALDPPVRPSTGVTEATGKRLLEGQRAQAKVLGAIAARATVRRRCNKCDQLTEADPCARCGAPDPSAPDRPA